MLLDTPAVQLNLHAASYSNGLDGVCEALAITSNYHYHYLLPRPPPQQPDCQARAVQVLERALFQPRQPDCQDLALQML